MKKCVVYRHVDGIAINDQMEHVLDDEGGVRIFDSRDQAEQVLRDEGYDDEAIRHFTFLESCGVCARCGSPLFRSLLPDYKYQCFSCNADFYGFEQESTDRYFAYLDWLRDTGDTNMYGATPYLQLEFPELAGDKKRAAQILCSWMKARSQG